MEMFLLAEHHLSGFLCHPLLGAVQLEEDIFKDLCIFDLCAYVYACVCHAWTSAHRGHRVELKSVVSFLMWVVGTELRSPRRADHDFNC